MTTPRDSHFFYTLIAILVFVPLPYASNRPMYWAITEIAIFILFSVWLVTQANPATLKQPVIRAGKWPLILLALVCLWVLLQASGLAGFQSIDVHATYTQLIKSVSLLCLFMLTLALVNSRQRIRMLAWTLLLSGTFQAVYGTLGAISEGTSASGTFINRNHLAGYLEMTLAVGIGLLIADFSGSEYGFTKHPRSQRLL